MKIINTSLHPESLAPEEFDSYLSQGWYRMTQYLFSISHLFSYRSFDIDRVWWLRYHINAIQSHRSHRRIENLNSRFEVKYDKFESISTEDEALYSRYYQFIDFDGYSSLASCLFDEKEDKKLFNTYTITVLDGANQIAKAYIDLGEKAVLAKVNFYDPDYAKYSLGKFLILKTIEFMRKNDYEWYYPGYIVVDRPKFLYKLFLGKESAEYYHPDSETWKRYCDSILLPEQRTEEEEHLLRNVYFRFFR